MIIPIKLRQYKLQQLQSEKAMEAPILLSVLIKVINYLFSNTAILKIN